VKLGLVALDGTIVQGNASLEANRTAASIGAEIEKMLSEDRRQGRQPAATGLSDPRQLVTFRTAMWARITTAGLSARMPATPQKSARSPSPTGVGSISL